MSASRFLYTATPIAILAIAGLATAQSSSPFASKKKQQAWDVPAEQSAPSYSAPSYSAPNYSTPPSYSAPPSYSTPTYTSPTYEPPAASYGSAYDTPSAPYSAPVMSSSGSGSPLPPIGTAQPIAAAQPMPAPSYQTYAAEAPISTAPVTQSAYVYTPPAAPRVTQAPDFGKPISLTGGALPPGLPKRGSSYAQAPAQPQPYESQSYDTPSYEAGAYGAQTYGTQKPVAQDYGQAAPYTQSASPYAPRSAPQTEYQNYTYAEPAAPSQGQYLGKTENQYQNQYQAQNQYPSETPYQNQYPAQGGTSYPTPQKPQSWKDRLGLGNIATVLRGAFNLGAAASNRDVEDNQYGPPDGWSEDFIGDAQLELEVSAITQGGFEYGVNVGGRVQHDPYRRGFGGRLSDCPVTVAGCSGSALGTSSLRGHTSQFYTAGEDQETDVQYALESAHVFLRSAYGDVTVGRDDGAAYIFSLGAPSLLVLGASNSPVDFTGLDSVKTVNDASGFSEKVTYTSPRLLGDQIGVGVQFGASYALNADACGVDYCVDRDITGVTRPEIEDVMEAGLALDRTFQNGMSVEGTVTYARGTETSGLAGLDDLESYGAGLELGYGNWTLGGSWLQSNNGLLDGTYTAYDAGLTWKPGALGFTLGYGHAEDDNVSLTSDQATFGITYDLDKFTVGTGVQYVDRTTNGVVANVLTPLDQTATSVFVQAGFKF